MALSIWASLSSSSFFYLCIDAVCILIGIFASSLLTSILFFSSSARVAILSASGINWVPGGRLRRISAYFCASAFSSSCILASSLYFYKYLGTLPKFLSLSLVAAYRAVAGLFRGGFFYYCGFVGGRGAFAFYGLEFDGLFSLPLASASTSCEGWNCFWSTGWSSPRDRLYLEAASMLSPTRSIFLAPFYLSYILL